MTSKKNIKVKSVLTYFTVKYPPMFPLRRQQGGVRGGWGGGEQNNNVKVDNFQNF